MAYFRARGKRWTAEVEINGQRASKTFDSKTTARMWAAEKEREFRSVAVGGWPRKTLSDAMDRYSRDISATKRGSRAEWLRFAALAQHFPDLASTVISQITTDDLGRWRDARLKLVTPGSVVRDINLLRHLFKVAVAEWKWLGESPFVGLRLPRENSERDRRVTASETRRIVRHLGYRTGDVKTKREQVALAFLIGQQTALRIGEILKISPTTYDAAKRVLRLEQHKTFEATRRPRLVPITPAGARLIASLPDGKFTVAGPTVDALFRRAVRELLIENLHFHDSRAEALTRLARRYDILTLARISGHRDLRKLQIYFRESSEQIAARFARKPSIRQDPKT